jgi:mono/diheme cytochrome c family protein
MANLALSALVPGGRTWISCWLAPAVAAAALLASGCGGDSQPTGSIGTGSGATLVEQGGADVAELGCPSCHQPADVKEGTLAGQTLPLSGTMIYGPNLTPDMDTGIGPWTDAQVTRAIREGLDDEGATLCTVMPRFRVTDDQAKAILAYLRSLPAVKRTIPESMCP